MWSEAWWLKRAAAARALMAKTFAEGMEPLDRVEPRLAAAIKDILARPGSLVRAAAAYLVGCEMGLTDEISRAVACGVEYLHTASLVFDDLPAMDDARTRRGAVCPHVVHGEAVAMLAALALINRGYRMLWDGIRRGSGIRREQAAAVVDARLGATGMIGGQAFDLKGWHGDQSPAEVSEVAARKTGDLLSLTLVLPAIIGRGSRREIRLLDRIGVLRGLAYQAADDLKDVLGSDAVNGKTAGRDAQLARPNLAAAEGLPAAIRRFRRLCQTGDRLQAALPGPSERWGMLDLLRVSLPEYEAAGIARVGAAGIG